MTGAEIMAAIAGAIAAARGLDFVVAWRVLEAIIMTLVVPGWCISLAVYPRRIDPLVRITLTLGLSIAFVVLGGLVLNALAAYSAAGWLVYLTGVSGLGLMMAVLRRNIRPPTRWAFAAIPTGRAALAGLAGFAVMAVGTLAALALARAGVSDHRPFAYTGFWLVQRPSDPEGPAWLGIANSEKQTATYAVDLMGGGEVIGRMTGITLRDGENYVVPVPMTSLAAGDRLEAWLFREPDRSTLYRRVWLAGEPRRP